MKNIRWVVQNNLYSESDYDKIKHTCDLNNINFEGVKIIPFSPDLPGFTIDEKTNIYYGSISFINSVYTQLNKPKGVFFNDSFSMEKYLSVWGEYMINSEAKLTSFKEFSSQNHDKESLWFIRPDADDKSFAGQVMSFEDIIDWETRMQKVDNIVLDENTKIIVSPPYNIRKEWRNYIIGGKVITSSLYRKDFRLNKSRKDCPEDMIKFVEDRCKTFMPHDIFVMDIALCGGEYYIIECGSMNSCGFYDCDVSLLIEKISEFISL
jgi:hypothetical protein